MTVSRRSLAQGGGSVVAAMMLPRAGWGAAPAEALEARAADLERTLGARLGMAITDTHTGRDWGHRANERFPMCSTFKALAAAALLARADAGAEQLSRRVVVEPKDILSYAPVTKTRVGGNGMTLGELCEAAVTLSDNTAGNLLLASIGGPQGLTAFARSLGDEVTRLDRTETALNEALPGDPRDTTTPNAMASDLRALVLGDALSPKSRAQLQAWLAANATGGKRLRAGLPAEWKVGDKTGTGERGTANDVAVIWPLTHPPVIVTVYLTGATSSADAQSATIADVARAVSQRLGV